MSAPAASQHDIAAYARTREGRRRRRKLIASLGWGFCALSMMLLSGAMVWILGMVLVRGIGGLNIDVFTEVTQGTGGGLLNAIEGTAVIAVGTVILAVPFGIAAGVYVAEYRWTWWARTIRFLSDVLVGVPSIVLGYFGYIALVEWAGWHFSLAAACITLAVLCLPYICRTTELALREVPDSLRESGYALGAGPARVTFSLSMRLAMPGILTGVLLALAISVGETAPLLYTAGWSSYLWNGQVVQSPIGYLTYAIWAFINEPFASANALAYAAAFLTTAFVLVVSLAARLILLRYERRV
jgi:phosphate transport system permease protein